MTTQRTSPEAPVISKNRLLLIFGALLATMFLSSLDQTVFSTALPTIVGELDGVESMLWVSTAYILASTIMMPMYGRFGDLFGRKGLYVFAILAFLAGSVIGGLATDMGWLIAGRAVQGIGGGGLIILSQAIIADVVPARQRGRYLGVLGAVFGLSSVIGPLLGGWFTEGIGWRWAFWINIPLGILALVAVIFALKLPRPARVRAQIDVTGITLLSVAVTALVLLTSWGGTTYEWDSPVILALIATTLVAATLFVMVERRVAQPIIPLHLFRSRNFNLATIAGLVFAVAMFGAIAYLPTYVQMAHGLSATASGYMLLPMIAGLTVTSIGSGMIASATGRYKWLPIIGAAVVGAALVAMSTLTVDTSLWLLGTYLFALGAGIGLGLQILVLIVQNSFTVEEVGTATAGNNFFREIGASLGSAIVGAFFTANLTTLLVAEFPAGGGVETSSLTPSSVATLPDAIRAVVAASYNDALTPVFLYLAPLMAISAIVLLFIKETALSTESRIKVVSNAEYRATHAE